MKKMLMMVALILGVSAMAEDAATGAMATMKKDFDVDKALENQNMNKITNWLGEKIHKYGRLKDTTEIIKKVTGEELNPKYYISYLKEKYKKIYEI